MKKIFGALIIAAGVGIAAPSFAGDTGYDEVYLPMPVVEEIIVVDPSYTVVTEVDGELVIGGKVTIDGQLYDVVADPSTGEPVIKFGPGHFSSGWTGPYHSNACPIRDIRYDSEQEWYSACTGLATGELTHCGCEIAGADGVE